MGREATGHLEQVGERPAQNHDRVIRRMLWPAAGEHPEVLLTREWLVSNGLGGYASGTISGVMTRRYHGLLIAALKDPAGRVMMLNHVAERLRLPDGRDIWLTGHHRVGAGRELHAAKLLREFRLELGLPVWEYAIGSFTLEKRLLLPHRQNTVHVSYRLTRGDAPLELHLRPSAHFRPHDAPVSAYGPCTYRLTSTDHRYELVTDGFPALRLCLTGDARSFTVDWEHVEQVLYAVEESRGYDATGQLESPGYFSVRLGVGAEATLMASTEPWEAVLALEPGDATNAELGRRQRLLASAAAPTREGLAAELVLAADQFIILRAGRPEDEARARAEGDEPRTMIAGYHWFTDWGRDTMISLEGLALVTGRHLEAGYILRTFAHYVRDGLVPNLFPEGAAQGQYNTADATLWFFHAVDRYLTYTNDRATVMRLLPLLGDIVRHHEQGTRFGIRVDGDDLLRQGEPGLALTWMDAKMEDWVITPRRGKAVEINALWYNALRLLAAWLDEGGDHERAQAAQSRAERVYAAFNERFWYAPGGHLYDVVDGETGDDPACRPNQLFAIALRHPVLEPRRWRSVVEVARDRLLTPVGLRSLAPDHPDYKPTYHGDLRTRDAAYHQGTVWAWLIGPFIDAWLKAYPEDRAGARRALHGFAAHLGEACLGSISEVFDAEPPFTPRGCVAQAWSVAEVLRAWVKTA